MIGGNFLCQHRLLFEEGRIGETGPSEKGFFVGTGCLRKVGSVEPVGCEGLLSQPTEMTHWVQGQQRVSSSGRGILDSLSDL